MAEKLPSKSNAQPTVFGFDFQVIAGLILTLRNIKDLKNIAIEGPLEDIEIELTNGNYIYAQAKSVVNPLKDKGNSSKFKSGLTTLQENSKENDIEKLIYVSNTYWPFGKRDKNSEVFWPLANTDSVYSYTDLKDSTIIEKFTEEIIEETSEFDLDKFEIHFYKLLDVNDDKTKYALVYDEIKEFLGKIGPSYTPYYKDIFNLWHSNFHRNQSKKQLLPKRKFLWPVIVQLGDKLKDQSDFHDYFEIDEELALEINGAYNSLIEELANNFEISNLIINDYRTALKADAFKKYRGTEKNFQFIKNSWKNYQSNIYMDGTEIEKFVVQLVMWRILTSQRIIRKVRKEGGL